jgi:hypothetical protein
LVVRGATGATDYSAGVFPHVAYIAYRSGAVCRGLLARGAGVSFARLIRNPCVDRVGLLGRAHPRLIVCAVAVAVNRLAAACSP